jgi:hypothetical protein
MLGTMEVAALAGLFYNRLLWIIKEAFFSFSRGYKQLAVKQQLDTRSTYLT